MTSDCLALCQQFKLQLAKLTATQQRLEAALSNNNILQQSNVNTTERTTNNNDANERSEGIFFHLLQLT